MTLFGETLYEEFPYREFGPGGSTGMGYFEHYYNGLDPSSFLIDAAPTSQK